MQQLLQQALTSGIASDYITQLLAAFPTEEQGIREQGSYPSPPLPSTPAPQPLIDPLNQRETSILRLMAAGLSNREIAEEMYLSANTIKWYASHIYSKLGVKKRAEAVDRAHELGIL